MTITGGEITMAKYKFTFKDGIKLTLVIGGLLFFGFMVLQLTNNPLESTTKNQVTATLETQGYTVTDVTERRKAETEAVVEAVEVRDGDFYFTYILFTDDKYSLFASQKFYSYLRSNRYDAQHIETEKSMSNYSIYTLTSSKSDKYTVNARVGNTVVYAESSETDSNIIKNIMKEIGYFKN